MKTAFLNALIVASPSVFSYCSRFEFHVYLAQTKFYLQMQAIYTHYKDKAYCTYLTKILNELQN